MTIIKNTVSTVGNETDFVESFTRSLMDIDERIICDTSQFHESNDYKDISFTVNICGFDITFTRSSTGASTSFDYSMTYTINNTINKVEFYFSNTRSGFSTNAERTWKYKIIKNDNFINIRFYEYNEDINGVTLSNSRNLCFIISEDKNFVSQALNENPTSILDNLFYSYNDEENTLGCSFINQFNYSFTDQKIETEKNKPLIIHGSNTLYNGIPGLLDCSIIAPDRFYIINDKKYYSLNSNTLIEIEEE